MWHFCIKNKQRVQGKSRDLNTKIEITRWNASFFTTLKKNNTHIKTKRRLKTRFFNNTSEYLDLLNKNTVIISAKQDK